MTKRPTILLVDDEPHVRTLVEYNLRLEGFEVLLAEDGLTGLKMARKKKPDMILLDVMMPGMNGLEVLSELKHSDGTQDIPVFMLTAKTMMGDIERALGLGADDYITKPFEPEALGQIIRKKLEKHAQKAQEEVESTDQG